MTSNKSNVHIGSGAGGASIVMIFTVLCLTIFAVLTLMSAKSEFNLSQRYADSISDYYKADSAAVDYSNNLLKIENTADIYSTAAEYNASVTETNGILNIVYYAPINEIQSIRVVYKYDNGVFTLIEWKKYIAEDWSSDDEFSLMVPKDESD